MKRCLVRFLAVVVLLLAGVAAGGEMSLVEIDYFFETGCDACRRVGLEVLPELEVRYEGFYALNRWDVGIESNVVRLVAYQEALNITGNEPVCMVVDYGAVLNGVEAIKNGLFGRIDEAVAMRMELGWVEPVPIAIPEDGMASLKDRAKGFAVPLVVLNGLLDGINPCAISTLVFFMSLLAVSNVKGSGLLVLGITFCLSSFMTYTALGLGAMRILRSLSGFPMVQFGIELLMGGALLVLALLSWRDAVRYKRTGRAEDVVLQLPKRIKERIHGVMRRGLGMGSVAAGGLVVGCAVTVLESVCTGQVYLPTLAVIVKSGLGTPRELGLLVLYNVMFVVPLAVAFVLTYQGVKTEAFVGWSKQHVVVSKVALGVVFVVMALVIVLG